MLGIVPIEAEQSIGSVIALVGRDQFFAQVPDGKADVRGQPVSHVDVEASVVFLIGVVWGFVVFKAVNPQIVVHVDPVEEVGSVHAVSEKGFVVVGNAVGDG